jgi:starch synthase
VNILFLSPEAVPFAKTGGLGDVAGSLPRALAGSEQVTLMMPGYATQEIRHAACETVDSFLLSGGGSPQVVVVRKAALSAGLSVVFIHNQELFGRAGLYGDDAGDYPDNFTRFLFFQRAALQFIVRKGLRFDIVHANDWQTALFPLLMRLAPVSDPLRLARSVFSIHNLGYQGIFPAAAFRESGLPEHLFAPDYLEFYGDLNCLKAGIIFADRLVTVSPNYAREILTPEKGFGLDGLLRKHARKLQGILNGVDYGQWDPRRDPHIARPYAPETLAAKRENKAALLAELGLPGSLETPLLAMITRLSQQKGIDLLPRLLPRLFQQDALFILLGKGDRSLTNDMEALAARFPERMRFMNVFDEKAAHRLQAAADILFMPSVYEPCGLNQIVALRYGTVPVVRSTGGLEDSVVEFDPAGGQGTGFKFSGNDLDGVMAAIQRALAAYADPGTWSRIQKNAMAMDFSWERAVPQYLELYKKSLSEDAQHV